MLAPIKLSFESKCVCRVFALQMHEGDILRKAPASGFFWRNDDVPYLVTNRHCVTGKNHQNDLIQNDGFEPTHLGVQFHKRGDRLSENVINYLPHSILVSLYKDGNPDWIEHATGRLVDVVALALDGISVECINDRKLYDDWQIEVGADCMIVGYPEGLTGAETTPIWKRGSIATEPNLNYKDKPVFLCDSATRPGLSGGPVFARAIGFFNQELGHIDPYRSSTQFFGQWPVFIGVYAGREGESKDGFQLGRVWKKSVLVDMFEKKTPAESPFIKHRDD
jgi:hypothetical protein